MDRPSARPSWPLSPSQAQDLDRLCGTFEAAWRAGQRPPIEAYLGDLDDPLRAAVLRELLVLDLAYRRRAGESPTPAEYRARFPASGDVIDAVFLQTVSSGDTPATLPPVASRPVIPGYDLLEELGRGGMGVVYKARQRKLQRLVAIKVTLPGGPVERFRREATLLAQVKSPHVVAVHDFDVLADGSPMLVMEWVEGSDLRRLMKARGGRLAEAEALPWMRQTAEGMLAAAEQGIIHRDLKPSNILLDAKGRARVADFGLARGPLGVGDRTQTGSLMGTPHYMAPEQAEDPRGVDTRADVYSFGAAFYHALTGEPPFDGETEFAILFKHKMEPLVSPRARNPELSERTGELLERCLAKSPGDRFPSFAEVLRQLEPAPPAASPWEASDDPELAGYLARYQARRDVYLAGREVEPRLHDAYDFPRGRKLVVLRGDLTAQAVDALVSSDTYYLTMNYGVSLALRAAAGPEVEREARRYVPVRPGRAVVTSAGKLPARFIFHAVTIGATQGQVILPSRDLISELLASCFYHADTLSVASIALPLLGTGGAGFSRPVCLDTMFRFLARMLLRGLTGVREARVVLFD